MHILWPQIILLLLYVSAQCFLDSHSCLGLFVLDLTLFYSSKPVSSPLVADNPCSMQPLWRVAPRRGLCCTLLSFWSLQLLTTVESSFHLYSDFIPGKVDTPATV